MKLTSQELLLLTQCAISAAYQAGEVINSFRKENISISSKNTGSSLASQVVTEVDLLSQNTILNALSPTFDLFDLALLTEESNDNLSRLEKDYFWCIDPLDGTLPFIEQTEGYAVSIALVSRSGAPYIGVVYNPIEQTLYHAVKGQGVFKNSQPWQQNHSITPNNNVLTLITDRSFLKHPLFKDTVRLLKEETSYKEVNIIHHGGAVMNACWTIESTNSCYFKYPKTIQGGGSIWDFAATACLFNEMGAITSDIKGEKLQLNQAESTFMNKHGVLYTRNTALSKTIKHIYTKLNEQ